MKNMKSLQLQTIKFLTIAILICLSISSFAGIESKFPTVKAMIEDFNDYSTSSGTFKIITENTLHIQLSPQVSSGELPEVIEESVKRALVYGVYRSFIHTPIDQITVTVLPQEIDFKTQKTRPITGYERTISKKRDEALNLIKKYLKINSFSELVTESKMGNTVFPNQWTEKFNHVYYNDQGYPGLNRFFGELAK